MVRERERAEKKTIDQMDCKRVCVCIFLGEILIKNWNPLPIESVTENRTVTVQDILGDLMNIAVLQIRISK